ncbi:MAG: hypothetical protein AAF518_27155 [Spirochaetota bacterium]
MKKLISILVVLQLFSCDQSTDNNDNQTAAALAFLATQNSTTSCLSTSSDTTTFSGVTRTAYSISGTCSTDLGASFTADSLTTTGGTIVAGSTTGRMATSSGSDDEMNVEITYTLNDSSGSITVLTNGSASGATMSGGTGFYITPSNVAAISNTGSTSTLPSSPSSTVGTTYTLCLEVHNESGIHVFGWSKACSSLTTAERGSYEFEIEGFTSTFSDKAVGFVLQNATISSFTISTGAIGTAGRLLQP